MEILFCGTAAAEGWPALFCACGACRKARELGGKNVRSRAAYMVGDRIRIDFGPDSNLHQQKYGLAYEKLSHLLVTHSHDDHWFVQDLAYRRKGFSVVPDEPLHVWGNEKVERKFTAANGDDWGRYRIEFHRLAPWEPIALGEGLRATPVLAAHDRSEACVNYLLEHGGRAALLAHDTGWYDEPAWDFLGGKSLDFVAFDCTYGLIDHERNHMGGLALVRARDELAKRGALSTNARAVATHFSHNSGSLHEEMVRFFEPHGLDVAWDGMRVEL
jgi:phosphoribosyl 1,2-cyclic phosphate phosphodiesterase